jgi:hypothetical protein
MFGRLQTTAGRHATQRSFQCPSAASASLQFVRGGKTKTYAKDRPWPVVRQERPEGWRKKATLFELIKALPSSTKHLGADANNFDAPLFANKNGRGMKFFRDRWKHAEPCYYMVTKYLKGQDGKPGKVWAQFTWRGETKEEVVEIDGKEARTPGWRFIRT